uniref:Uncharacterized protein n=1 Tax=Tanacetum cinerariifolium TaxID=118510 RepID=A0A6L2JKZ0_TANCI|nr:hypothetical protein [Tanacetum cinerariifolium]
METELKLEEKFRELCEEVSNFVKEGEDVVQELERLSGNHVAKETVRLLRHGQKRDLYTMTHLQIMVNESHLSVREKHSFVSKMNLWTLYLDFANGLHNLWAELLERTNERQLFITDLDGLCLSVMTYKILKFLNEVQKHDLIQLLELRKMIVGTYRQVSRKIVLIETIRSL